MKTKQKYSGIKKLLFTGLWMISLNASAIPTLQLTIGNGTYNTTTETTVASSNPFNLYAILTPGNGAKPDDIAALLADTYRISAAVVPKTGPLDVDRGTFTFGSTTVQVTDDMVYGVAPIDTVAGQLFDTGDLPDHGIFDTFFKEFEFKFTSTNDSSPFDVAASGNIGKTPEDPLFSAGTGSYWFKVPVNVSNLSLLNSIHFDLYNTNLCTNDKGQCQVVNDVDINDFAPFSHDAQSGNGGGGGGGGGGGQGGQVPEPNVLALFGMGLAVIGLSSIRRKRKAN